jgi:NADH-quinone oxidoreductase subunit N
LLLPDALVAVAAVICLFAWRVRFLRRPAWLTVAIAGVLVAAALGVELVFGAQLKTLFHGGFAQDRFALFAKAALLLATLVIVLASPWAELGRGAIGFTLLATLGGMVSAGATDLAGLWVGLELAVLASVAAIAGREVVAARRALLLGGSLGALAALGMALVAAAAGTTELPVLRTSLGTPLTLPLALAVLLVVAALLGQLGAAPWSGPLAAGAAGIVLIKFAGSVAALAGAWAVLVPAAAAAAMVIAALGALAGGPARGIIGWAGLLQLGWIVAGLAGGARLGIGSSLFLFGAYLLAFAAAPLALGEAPHGLAGLADRSLPRAVGFAACLLSLAGVPPLAGFFGEFAIAAQLARSGLFWLVAVGFFATAVVSFAVLRDLRLIFLASPGEQVSRTVHGRLAYGGALIAAALLVAYGFFANPISGLAVQGAAAVGLR